MNDKTPILLDALYINAGGGLGLLEYLLEVLVGNQIEVCLLKDARCRRLSCEGKLLKVYELEAGLYNRYKFYVRNRERFRIVLCFANLPCPVKMPCPVYTYVHNANLLQIPSDFTLPDKIINYGKQFVIRALSANTDHWIVQTLNMESLLKNVVRIDNNIHVIPFYKIPACDVGPDDRTDYILVGNYTGSRGHELLLEAWTRLQEKGRTPVLHLTVDNESFCSLIDKAANDGIKVINHGILPFDKVFDIYRKCKATVYPSLNESLGLGLIEALETGCDVIAPDLPYVWSVCQPSETFDVRDVDTVVDAILKYEDGKSRKSVLTINNKIEDLIDILR